MHYLVTGHTGFKGSWLTLMLKERGHTVSGFSLDPEPSSLFIQANIRGDLEVDRRGDIRNLREVEQVISEVRPDVVIHLAAQPLVRDSYMRPRWTIETNVMGTLNVLEAAANAPSIRAQVIVTTDKVYENHDQMAGYVETDALGAADPYSTSKAMADLLTQSWIRSFSSATTAIARAGNVIGGGDVSADRLLPDILAAFSQGLPAQLRYPQAVRPWQHVLDCLNGYLALVDHLVDGGHGGAWNFGPGKDSFRTVEELTNVAGSRWGHTSGWQSCEGRHPHEAGLLALDSSKSHSQLGWRNYIDFQAAVDMTVDWHKRVLTGESPREVTLQQISWFNQRAAV